MNDRSTVMECISPKRVYICDGVGGNVGGREASMFLCEHIGDDFHAINREMIQYGRQIGKPQMASTLTGLVFGQDGIMLVHAGNTRLYTVRGGYLNQMTTDQTTCEWLRQTGNAEAAENYNQNEIRCAFGGGNPAYLKDLVVRRVFPSHQPKMLMMTTDGVHDYLTTDQMESILRMKVSTCDRIEMLIESAVNHGSKDDCTVVLMETCGL